MDKTLRHHLVHIGHELKQNPKLDVAEVSRDVSLLAMLPSHVSMLGTPMRLTQPRGGMPRFHVNGKDLTTTLDASVFDVPES
jgi:hypothetical protein